MDFDASYTHYQTRRSWLRKWVRKLYLRSAARRLEGPTLDFGCGVGELLERLPGGSRGLEYNQATVDFCRRRGLPVDAYDGFSDGWQLSAVAPDARFDSMVISHVLEHLEQPAEVLHGLLLAAEARGIRRVLVIVPGRAGYRIDPTHRTFVDAELLALPEIVAETGFHLAHSCYFPGDFRQIGDWFPHHELQALYLAADTPR
jgi:SAM-dependent methyltransferase